MKVMFICGARLTENGLRCASWIKSLICGLPDDINVTVAGEGADVNSIIKCMAGDTEVSFFGFSVSGSERDFADIIKAVNPDATVIFGTEKTYTLFALNACKLAGIKGKTALFAQGIALACAKSYHEGVPHAIVRRWTFRDFARRSNILTEQKNMFISAAKEKQAIEKTEHFIGRTTLDNAVLRMYNPDAAYYKCNDVMRSVFYSGQWRYENCEKHRIFISQFYYPLKGFHYLLEAAAQLKNKYPGLKIAAAGYNPVLKAVDENEIKDSSYIRYIKSLIKKYNLKDNIELLGELNENEMKREYLNANVFVLPSTIENSPNSLGEAMLLGVPCVASDVGGVSDFAEHKKEAYLYPSSAPYLLEYYIDKVFSDGENAEKIGLKAKERAEGDYNTETNINRFTEILEGISNSYEKS